MDNQPLSRRLPPFAAIRAFEAVARFGNLREAAQELNLSISAVSHQLKSLEAHIGVSLFVRNHAGLRLSERGRHYAQALTKALDSISIATTEAEAEPRQTLSIGLSPSFAALWLLPRLAKFRRLAPSVDVQFVTSLNPQSLDPSTVDFRICYGLGTPPGCTRLFEEQVFPVCIPNLRESYFFDGEVNLSQGTLIISLTMPEEWDDWFSFSDFRGRRPSRLLTVDNRAFALEAAMEGLGAAMGRTPFVTDALGSGRLVRASRKTFANGFCYYLHPSSPGHQSDVAKRFLSWLVSEASAATDVAAGSFPSRVPVELDSTGN